MEKSFPTLSPLQCMENVKFTLDKLRQRVYNSSIKRNGDYMDRYKTASMEKMKLYFQETNTPKGRATSDIEITKDGRKWLYFTAKENRCKYRMNKETGEIQISPYWRTGKDMYLK